MSVLKKGMSQKASDAFCATGIDPARIGQTIGNAPASAGVHLKDGVDASGNPYTCAVDLSVVYPTPLQDSAVKQVLEALAGHGFAAFYRCPGQDGWPSGQARHIHAVYAGEKMKPALRSQIKDWLEGRNGLAGHAEYRFWQPTEAHKEIVRGLFTASNG